MKGCLCGTDRDRTLFQAQPVLQITFPFKNWAQPAETYSKTAVPLPVSSIPILLRINNRTQIILQLMYGPCYRRLTGIKADAALVRFPYFAT